LPEVCGNAAVYVDPYDVLNIKEVVQALLESPELAQKLSEAGKKRAALFDMKCYLERLCAAYASALQKL
jgi:glycosyltransferase involved in cell wall biosynthesis